MDHDHSHDHGLDPGTEDGAYVAPSVSDLGTVTEVTLGSAGFDRADDTQYFD